MRVTFDAIKWQICITLRFSLFHMHQSYKIVIWFIWKIFPYLCCRFRSYYKGREWLLHVSLRIPKWKFNVSVTMGQVFHLASDAVFCFFALFVRHICRLRLETNSTKTLFPCFDIAHCFCEREKKVLQFRHVWWLHVLMCSSREMFQ